MKQFEKKDFILTITYCNGLNEVRRMKFYVPDSARTTALRWYRSCPQATAIRVQFDDGREIMNMVRRGVDNGKA